MTAIVVFGGYYLGAKLGFALTQLPNPIAILWPPNAILFAALLLTPYRSWGLVIAAALPAHVLAEMQSGVPTSMIAAWFLSNVSEALMGAAFVRVLVRGDFVFGDVRQAIVFVASTSLAVLLSSFFDSGLVLLNAWGQGTFWQLWHTRLLSNVTASLVIVPAIVVWAAPRRSLLHTQNAWEAATLLAALLAAGFLAFDSHVVAGEWPAMLCLPLPLMLWAALRFGPAGASASLFIVGLLAILGASGAFGGHATRPPDYTSTLQMFLVFTAPTLLILAAIVEEQRGGKARLINAESRFAKAFGASPDAMFIARTPDWCLIEVNEQWERLLGYKRQESVGRSIHELPLCATPEDRVRLNESAKHQGKSGRLEIDLRSKGGDIQRVVAAVYSMDLDGQRCVIACLRDITDRKRVEDALRESGDRLRLALQAGRMGVWDWNRRTGVLTWSKEHFEIMGLSSEIAPPTYETWTRYVHPEDLESAQAAMRAAIASRVEYHHEYRVMRPDGSMRWLESRAQPQFDEDGECVRVMGLVLDISERKHAEETNQRLFQASRLTAMGELTASIAHEINQPMTSIMSNVDAAEMALNSDTLDLGELREILKDIRNDDMRASEIVRHVRGLAKDRAMEIQLLDVNEVIAGVARLIAPASRRRRIALTTRFTPLPCIRADRIQLQQVLMNLVLNAMDATETATDARRFVEIVSGYDDGDEVEVVVRDHGHGIPSDLMATIFDSFVTTKKDGMGLGLSIARTLIEAHGGRITARNHPEGGASFRFTLPVHTRVRDDRAR